MRSLVLCLVVQSVFIESLYCTNTIQWFSFISFLVGFPNAKGFGDRGPECAKDGINETEFGIVRLYELQ